MTALPSILFHRGTAWNGDLRGSTNVIARFFREAGYPVAWLRRPHHIGHTLLRGMPLGTRWQRHEDGVLEISPFTTLPIIKSKYLGAAFWMQSARMGYASIMPSLAEVFRSSNQPQPDIIWTSGGDGGMLGRDFPKAKSVVQCVDIYEAYAGSAQNRLECRDYKTAGAIVAIGHSLADFLSRNRGVQRDRITVIGQGADLELLARRVDEPGDMAGLPHPRMIWVGSLAKADPELMEAALDGLPVGTGSLVLIGPPSEWASQLSRRDERVHLLGPRPAQAVAACLKYADIGLMLYDQRADPRIYLGQNPLKLYEMAAAGLPIISTPHAEFQFSMPPVLTAETADDVRAGIAAVLEGKDARQREVLDFAAKNGWDRRFREAETVIESLLNTACVTGLRI